MRPRVEIPSGLIAVRTIAGMPLEAGLLLAVVVAIPWILFKTLWTVPVLIVPLWGFLRWHTRKEPLFLRTWAGQLSFKRYYRHG